MPDDLLLRGLSPEVQTWIEQSSHESRVSRNQFLLNVLSGLARKGEQLPIFEPPATSPEFKAGLPFRFIDLFSGIGGMRLGLEAVGGECVFSCERDPQAQRTYKEWFGELPAGDINEPGLIDSIPAHDLLAAGFPCQPFSIAGVSKKNSLGRQHGFKDESQGNLFFKIMECVDAHRPAVLLLENVKNLKSHDGGQTWKRIEREIREREYVVAHRIFDAAPWVPQHRERIFIVAFDQKVFGADPGFRFSEPPSAAGPVLRDILETAVDDRYTLSDALWKYLKDYAKGHQAKGNGFGFGMPSFDSVTRTLSARYYKDGSEILISQGPRNPRKLTPREAARIMGFPEHFPIVVSDTQAYRQFGNAVVPAVVEWIGRDIIRTISTELRRRQDGVLLPPRPRKKVKAA